MVVASAVEVVEFMNEGSTASQSLVVYSTPGEPSNVSASEGMDGEVL